MSLILECDECHGEFQPYYPHNTKCNTCLHARWAEQKYGRGRCLQCGTTLPDARRGISICNNNCWALFDQTRKRVLKYYPDACVSSDLETATQDEVWSLAVENRKEGMHWASKKVNRGLQKHAMGVERTLPRQISADDIAMTASLQGKTPKTDDVKIRLRQCW